MRKVLLVSLLFANALGNCFTLIVGDLFAQFTNNIGMAAWLFETWMILVGAITLAEIAIAVMLLRENDVAEKKPMPALVDELEQQQHIIEREFSRAKREEPVERKVVERKPLPPMPKLEELKTIKIIEEEKKENEGW